MNPLLHIKDAGFSYPGRTLFRSVNLVVSPGEIIHLRGPNGAGKSTLLRICAGLLAAQSGDVDVDPRNFEYLPAESNGLHLKLGAIDNLSFWYELRSGRKPRVEELRDALAAWKLDHPLVSGIAGGQPARLWLPAGKFSTGMKRRLALARVMLNAAPLWLLDEPVSGLDEDAVQTFVTVLRQHLAKGGAAVIVSHDTRIFTGFDARVLDIPPGGPR